MSLYLSFLTLLVPLVLTDDSSSSSGSVLQEGIVPIVKTVLATTNYIDAYNSVMYMLPTSSSQELTEQECGSSGKEEFTDSGFQLHQPYVPIHNAGIFQPLMIEQAFYQKWLNYLQTKIALDNDYSDISDLIYEPFFDHSFALYKNDITDNINAVLNQENSNLNWNILYTFLKWDLEEEVDGKSTFISLMLYIPTTQVTIELITEYNSDLYDQYLDQDVVFETEPRMSFQGFTTYPWNNEWTVVPIKQSRAVTDLDTNVAWYQEFMGAKLLISGSTEVNGNTVNYANVYLPYGEGFEIAFYERNSDDSYGEFELSLYESGINDVHKNFLTSSSCGFNRWFDNHYAINMINYGDDFKNIYDSVSQSGQRYILFVFSSDNADPFGRQGLTELGIDYFFFLFTVEPNGNTIEIVGYFEDDELAANGLVWGHNFCPEICKDATAFTTNFIDNGQYTSIAKNLDKYSAFFTTDDTTDDDTDGEDTANDEDDDDAAELSADNQNIHPHKKKRNQKSISILLITIISAIVFIYATYLAISICGKSKKNNKISPNTPDEIRPLRYGSTSPFV